MMVENEEDYSMANATLSPQTDREAPMTEAKKVLTKNMPPSIGKQTLLRR